MSSPSSDLTALSYNVESIGKLFSDSKTRHVWTMDVDGETHVVVVTASWNSGKFVVELNGFERFHSVVSGVFTYSFKFRDRFFRIQQQGDQLLMSIDTVPFNQFSSKAKAAQAALLKTYESRARPQVPQVESSTNSRRSESPPPFAGDLAKRLGKREPAGYVEQGDEEDFFAAPVNIQSFMNLPKEDVSSLTVIPNLIEFGDIEPVKAEPVEVLPNPTVEPAPATPLTGPVTPRDQISPSKLANPFDAFDELDAVPTLGPEAQGVDNPFIS